MQPRQLSGAVSFFFSFSTHPFLNSLNFMDGMFFLRPFPYQISRLTSLLLSSLYSATIFCIPLTSFTYTTSFPISRLPAGKSLSLSSIFPLFMLYFLYRHCHAKYRRKEDSPWNAKQFFTIWFCCIFVVRIFHLLLQKNFLISTMILIKS